MLPRKEWLKLFEDKPQIFDDITVFKTMEAQRLIIRQPFFGKIPSTLRYATWYNPSMFWIYATDLERIEIINEQNKAWHEYLDKVGLSFQERAIAMGRI